MKTNRELRMQARQIVKSRWFWRIAIVVLSLNFVAQAVAFALQRIFTSMEIVSWTDYLQAKLRAAQAGLGYTLPTRAAMMNMIGASAFQYFIFYVFAAICAFGVAGVALKAVRNRESGWFSDAFGGFRNPLGMAWLLALMNLKVFLWSLLFMFPGIVAAYRYRQAWYLKNEHQEWSAAKCLSESSRIMVGHKWQAFCLDCSYVGWLLLASMMCFFSAMLLAQGNGSGLSAMALVGSLSSIASMYFLAWTVCYCFVGRTVFYHELVRELACDNADNLV